MYAIGEPPRTPNEAFDALENVFGAEEFTSSQASEVLEEALEMSSSRAHSEINRLIRIDAIVEA